MYLPYLDYFRSVAKYESMTQAASHLHISQPALSQTIMKLEDELGVQLFHRKKGKLSLTSAGKLYYDCVERAFAELERGTEQIRSMSSSEKEMITVISTFPHLFSALINEYPALGSGLVINPFIYSLDQSVEKLVTREATLGVLPFCRPKRYDMRGEVLRQNKVFEERIFCVVGKCHPLADIGTVSLKDLQHEQFVVNEQNFDREEFDEIFATCGYIPDVLFRSNETRMINPLISSGKAVCLSPASDVMRDMSEKMFSSEIVALQISESPSRAVFLDILEDTKLSEAAKDFVQYIQAYFADQKKAVTEWEETYFSKI